jgi:hypothetical protein
VPRGELPEAVRLPDGRTEPFEPERIARTLFAAGERLGRADAFLARELTDGVLHFLATEDASPITTPGQIAEVVSKVVRELGHPGLALAYAERGQVLPAGEPVPVAREPVGLPGWATRPISPAAVHREIAREQLRTWSLASVFPRDLVSAHEEGLIQLTGLEHPRELDGLVASLPPGGPWNALAAGRDMAGRFLAVDGPEFDLAPLHGDPAGLADEFLDPVRFAAEVLGIRVVLNLGGATRPPRLTEASGPLFQGGRDGSAERRREIAIALADRASDSCFDVWWHVPAEGNGSTTIPGSVLERAVSGGTAEFVFDRPRLPTALGPGVDRQTPAALIRVGLDLARLIEIVGGAPIDGDVFLRKVGSLTRFAKTAGHVKQDFLRRHGRPEVRAAFLLDRARLVLVPTGLDAVARSTDRAPAEFVRDVLRAIRTAAETDRPRVLPMRVDPALGPELWEAVIGPGASARQQIRVGSQLQTVTGSGRLDFVHPDRRAFPAAEAADTIRGAAESAVTRARFVRP